MKINIKYWWLIFFINFSCCTNQDVENAGTISAGSPEAVDAGLKILEQGGNAVDAAIAIAFALTVTEPAQSGIGGQAQFLIYQFGADPIIVNGTSYSPSRLPENLTKTDLQKHRATTIPSLVRVLDYLWKNYGSGNIEWAELLLQSIRNAEWGFPLGEFRYRVLDYKAKELRKDPAAKKLFLSEDGDLINIDLPWKQHVLAKTLKQLARRGADDFYTGDIAKKIADDMRNNDGWITVVDLNNFPEPNEQIPLRGNYRGYDIYTMPPPGGGWVIIQALNILEQFTSDDLTLESKSRLKIMAQALQLAHQSRSNKPIKNLIDYQKDVMQKISKDEAERLLNKNYNGETTHFSVVDKHGTVVSATLSINNYYGSKTASPLLGFLYNDYMNEFKINESGHPFNLRPNAMPYSSMTPTILMKDGQPVMAIGSPGSERIISAIVQVISLWIDAKLSIEDAVSHPRIHVTPDSVIYFESDDWAQEEKSFLKEAGFTFDKPLSKIIIKNLNPYFGGVHAIAIENNQWKGAADPRRDGSVGYSTK